jgi:hypothetical protein
LYLLVAEEMMKHHQPLLQAEVLEQVDKAALLVPTPRAHQEPLEFPEWVGIQALLARQERQELLERPVLLVQRDLLVQQALLVELPDKEEVREVQLDKLANREPLAER